MKLTELKKIIKEEIERVLNEAGTETAPTREKEKTKPATPKRREITPAKPKPAPAKATTEEIAKKIADRFKKGKK